MCEVEIKQTRAGPISRNPETNEFERDCGPMVEDYDWSPSSGRETKERWKQLSENDGGVEILKSMIAWLSNLKHSRINNL